jgi:crotonobetainyl-CoA:carnitine CoA-transferase CaiB-like acyl-CoA transferase
LTVGLTHGPDGAIGGNALDGLLVLELGARVSVSVCTSLLRQLGATVVAVEGAPVEMFKRGKATQRDQLMPGKLSIVPHAEDPLLIDLMAHAEVIVRSPDVDDLGRPQPERRPNQVDCTITAFGLGAVQDGSRPVTDLQMQALCGIVDTTGPADRPPVPIPVPIVECMAGMYAAAAVIAAVRVQRTTGAGQAIDMALFDCAFAALSTFLPKVIDHAGEVRRIGNRHPMAAPFNAYRAGDGWLVVCTTNDEQWKRLCSVMGQPALVADRRFVTLSDRIQRADELDALVQRWCEVRSVEDCLSQCAAAEIASAAIAPVGDFPRHANLQHRGMIGRITSASGHASIMVPGSPFRMSCTPGMAPGALPTPDADRLKVAALVGRPRCARSTLAASPQHALPLHGVRVVEIGHYTTAPLAAKHLASLGAEVIKIEPRDGEATRPWLPGRDGQGYFFTYTNSDKRSLALDLASPADAEELSRLLATSDVLVENLKPGTLAKRGFSSDEILRTNPRLVYCAVSGFGAESLFPGRPAVDTVIQAASGLMDLIRSDGVPMKSGISSADLLGAQIALLAVLAALEFRDRTGHGQYIDLSMQDIAAWATQFAWNRPGVALPSMLAASDGFVVAECEAGALDLVLAKRPTGRDELSGMSRQALAAWLVDAGIDAAPVYSVLETAGLDRVQQRELWIHAKDRAGTMWPLMASPLRLLGTPPRVARPIERLDADGAAIRRELRAARPIRTER